LHRYGRDEGNLEKRRPLAVLDDMSADRSVTVLFCFFLFRFLLGKTFTFFVYLLDELLTYLLTIIRPSDSGVRGSAEGHQRIFVYFNYR